MICEFEIRNYSSKFTHSFQWNRNTIETGAMSCIMHELDDCEKDLICHQALIGAKDATNDR